MTCVIPFIISNWNAVSSYYVGFLTRLLDIWKNFVLVPTSWSTAEISLAKLSQSDSLALESLSEEVRSSYNISSPALSSLGSRFNFSFEDEWMGLTKVKNYIPLIHYVPWIYLGLLFQVYISFLYSLSSDYIFSLKSQTVSVQFLEHNKYMFF